MFTLKVVKCWVVIELEIYVCYARNFTRQTLCDDGGHIEALLRSLFGTWFELGMPFKFSAHQLFDEMSE